MQLLVIRQMTGTVARRPPAVGAAGIDTVRLYPAGATLDARLATLARAIELAREIARFSKSQTGPR